MSPEAEALWTRLRAEIKVRNGPLLTITWNGGWPDAPFFEELASKGYLDRAGPSEAQFKLSAWGVASLEAEKDAG